MMLRRRAARSRAGTGLLDAVPEDALEAGQAAHIHWAEHGQVSDAEVEDGAASCHWPVLLSSQVDADLSLLCLTHPACHSHVSC